MVQRQPEAVSKISKILSLWCITVQCNMDGGAKKLQILNMDTLHLLNQTSIEKVIFALSFVILKYEFLSCDKNV